MNSANSSARAIGCVVLAAGSSQRFGSDKRNYRLPNGLTLLEQTLAHLQSVFDQRILVLRPDDTSLAAQFGNDWKIVSAADAPQGMGHSLAAAVPHIRTWSAAVIALADMPWVSVNTLQAIIQAVATDNLVIPHYRGQRGNPVGIGANYFHELIQLQGDTGARVLFQHHSDKVIKLEVKDPGILQDMDTPPAP
jgi:molybdenum cofactor cytidylyltransferase